MRNTLNFAGSDKMKLLIYIKLHILLIISQANYSAMFFQKPNNGGLDMHMLLTTQISYALYS